MVSHKADLTVNYHREGNIQTWKGKSIEKRQRAVKLLYKIHPELEQCVNDWAALWLLHSRCRNEVKAQQRRKRALENPGSGDGSSSSSTSDSDSSGLELVAPGEGVVISKTIGSPESMQAPPVFSIFASRIDSSPSSSPFSSSVR